jgi:peptide/nickel transport system permease protein
VDIDMTRYVLGRVAQAAIVLLAAYTVTFVILNLLPSDPVSLRLAGASTDAANMSPAQLHQLKAQFGLDKPVIVQYFTMLWHALHLDFGQSTSLSVPVSTVLSQRLSHTLVLTGISFLLMLVFGAGLAYLAAYVQWRPAKVVLTRLPALGVSMPQFWVGLLLIQVFSFELRAFPSSGTSDGLRSYLLPGVAMALPGSAMLAQVLMGSFARTLREPYITTARAKGLSHGVIIFRHALRNAALPALTILGLVTAQTVTYAVVVESVFSISGVGQLAEQAAISQDVPVVQGVVLVAAALFVALNLVVDLLYPLLDPRVAVTPKVV